MAYTLTQQLTSGMAGKGIVNTYDIDDRILGKTQEAINQDLYQKLVDTGNIAAGISTVDYDSDTKRINFRSSDSTIVCYLDATLFIKDGIVNSVQIDDVEIDNTLTKCLVISFNTDADKQDIIIPIKDIIDLDLFYTKTEIDPIITDLQNSRLFREENGGLKTSEILKAFGENSFAEGKGIHKEFELVEDYIPETNYIFLYTTDNVGEDVTIGSKLYYLKKVETTTVLSKSLNQIQDDSFLTLELESAFVKDINADENIYIKVDDEYVPIKVVNDYTAGDTEINVDYDAYSNIEEGATIYANITDNQYASKTITNLEHYHGDNEYEAIKVYFDSPIEYVLNTTDTVYIESGVASGEGSHVEGIGTNAEGDFSHAAGVFTNTTNEGEFACGNRNLSTPNVTLFSIGIGGQEQDKCDHLNAFEVNTDGDLFIKGTGGYDGTNISENGVKSVQEILSEAGNAALELRISAIESKLNSELTNQITGSISFSLSNLYAGYQKTVIATGSISLPAEIPVSKITSIQLSGNGQTVEESGQSSVVIQNSVSAPQTYTLTAVIAEPFAKTITKTATVNQICPVYIALVDSDIDTLAKVVEEIVKYENLYSPNSPVSNVKTITNKSFTYGANQRLAFICGQSGIRVKQVGGLADDPYLINGEPTTIGGMSAYVYLTGTQQAGTRNITFNP